MTDLTGMNLVSGNPLWRLLALRELSQDQVLQVLFKIHFCYMVVSLLPNALLD